MVLESASLTVLLYLVAEELWSRNKTQNKKREYYKKLELQ